MLMKDLVSNDALIAGMVNLARNLGRSARRRMGALFYLALAAGAAGAAAAAAYGMRASPMAAALLALAVVLLIGVFRRPPTGAGRGYDAR